MHFTTRRRAALAVLVSWPLGWFCVAIGWRLIFHLLQYVRNPDGFMLCDSGPAGLVSHFNGCGINTFNWGLAVTELLVLIIIAGLVAYGLARWVAQPLGSIADVVSRFGPNSLGLRLRSGGPADETRKLCDEIDAMLDRLAEGYEAQRRFASNASHELRTPLATQRALIEVSLRSALSPAQLELLSRQLLATNERNERLVDGLLTLAETERGLVVNNVLDLDHIVGDVVEMLRPAAAERGLEVTAALEPVRVRGEHPLLDRLANNLIFNAIKYNEPGGSVTVTTSQQGAFTVTNTGPQLAPEAVAGLFEPFARMGGERLDHGGGVGLGLTIARSVVAAHGGSVDAHANPGGGLVVVVRLPAL